MSWYHRGFGLVVSTLAFALIASCDQSDAAQRELLGTLEFRVSFEAVEGAFKRVPGGDGRLDLSRMRSVTVTEVVGAGGLSDLSEPALREVDEELPDASRGEYDYVSLRQEGEGAVLDTRSMLRLEDALGSATLIPMNLTCAIRWLRGEWEDYRVGRAVRFTLTDDSLTRARQQFMSVTRSALETLMRSIVRAEGAPDEAVDFRFTFSVDPFEIEYEGDRDHLEFEVSRMPEVVVRMIVYEGPGE